MRMQNLESMQEIKGNFKITFSRRSSLMPSLLYIEIKKKITNDFIQQQHSSFYSILYHLCPTAVFYVIIVYQ